MRKLPRAFYLNPDVVGLSQQLLGKSIFTRLSAPETSRPVLTGGIIVETEAYAGPEDRASHAYGGRRTQRTETMYRNGGTGYVYLCYGIHALFNVVTHAAGIPHAILIRAIQPTRGIPHMLRRRRMDAIAPRLTNGPGTLSQALGIQVSHDGCDLTATPIWICDDATAPLHDSGIVATPRVGVDYAGEHAQRPWRFRMKDNPWCGTQP